MQKEKIRNSILGILAFVLLFYEIIVLKGENYYLVSMAVLLIALFGFFAHFEKERPGVMLLTMIASLCALAMAGRIAIFHKNITNMLNQFTAVIGEKNINISDMTNKSRGEVAYTMLDIENVATQDLVESLQKIDGVFRVRIVK